MLADVEVGESAANDAAVVFGIPLGFHHGLPPAGGAAHEVDELLDLVHFS